METDVVAGDDRRAAELWDRFADDVHAYARRRVGASAAPDVVAEVFMVVVANPGKVPDDALPWLYRTAWNVVMNHRRRDDRQRTLPGRLPRGPAPADPADVVSERERVLAALEGLSAKDREVVMLVAWEGLDGERAARAAGCSVNAFQVRLHRARRRLERALADELETDPR